MSELILLPAVDVAGGQAVRLVQGAAGSETSYGDPVAAALAWQEAGASWLHLVDLDAAFGRGSNAPLLAEVAGKLDIAVEMSGGIRDDESLARALATGCARVNIGTAALEQPEWVRSVIGRHGDKIAVGLDVRGTTLAARGWTSEGGELYETLARLDAEGCARYVVTDVLKDGTLRGPNLALLRDVCSRTHGAGGGQRGSVVARRPARAGVFGARRSGRSDRGQGPVRGRVHPAGSPRGGGVVSPARRRVSSGVPFEQAVGYSRAVAAGDFIFVSGCTSMADGKVVFEGDMAKQTEQALLNVSAALQQLGASLADVVQTRIYVTDISRWAEAGEAHRLAFEEALPAATMVQVAALIDPRLLVEVEVDRAPGVLPWRGRDGAGRERDSS